MPFALGDHSELAAADGSLAGIVSFYSLIHIPTEPLVAVLRSLRRLLMSGGVLLVAVLAGNEVRHIEKCGANSHRSMVISMIHSGPSSNEGHRMWNVQTKLGSRFLV